MTRAYTARWRENINAVNGEEPALCLLEISHDDLATPIRVVNDVQNLTSNGDVYAAAAFDISMPNDLENQMPSAQLSIDNVDQEIGKSIEATGGARGATCRVMQVLRSYPDVIEWETTLKLKRIMLSGARVSAQLGYDDILNIPGIAVVYSPVTAPGLF
jgi:hypothetical protein